MGGCHEGRDELLASMKFTLDEAVTQYLDAHGTTRY